MQDPKKFAKNRMKKGSDYATGEVGCGTGLAGKICRHNEKKLNHYRAIKARMKKSIDFVNTKVAVSTKDQQLAEQTTNPDLVNYIKGNLGILKAGEGSSAKIPFPTGILTLSQREAGIYHGHFQDQDGQVIEKFENQTIEIITKNLQLKSLVPEPVKKEMENGVGDASGPVVPNASEIALSAHNRIDDLQRQVINQVKGIRIKYGDFELEIRKSVQDFVSDFKAGRVTVDKDVVRKAITSWRKHSVSLNLNSDHQAARELSENWETHQDSFCQFVDALSRGEDEQG